MLLAIFVAAASAFTFYRYTHRDQPSEAGRSFEDWNGGRLPLVYGQVGDYPVNVLYGYTGDVDETLMEDRLMLVGSDGRLPLSVLCGECTLSRIRYEIRNRTCTELLAEGEAEEWVETHDTAAVTLQLGSVVNKLNREYRLRLILSTADGENISYYSRLRRMDNLHAEEMVDYVMSFHNAAFDKGAAAQFAVNMESDGSADDNTLGLSTLHSSYQQITWGDLGPVQLGNVNCQILEMDAAFGSFLLEYEVQAEDANSEPDRYLVSDYFSLQWSEKWEGRQFYMMDYRRTVSELMSGDDSRLRDRGLELGILRPETVSVAEAPGGRRVFSVSGELWSFDPEKKELTRIFTFRQDDEDPRRHARNYGIQVLEAGEKETTFLVYGYMESGAHEGQMAISCLRADMQEKKMTEVFFLPCSGSLENMREGVETLSSMGSGGEVYLMVGDAVYSINWADGEVAVLVDRAAERHLAVNDAQTAIAWEMETREGETGSVQIFYLDTGESQIVGAGKGDWIAPCGFIEEDCVLGLGHTGETVQAGAVQVDPYYAIVIRERSGEEAARYEQTNVRISSVSVNNGQVMMDRVSVEGGVSTQIAGDTLIRNTNPDILGTEWLTSENLGNKERVWLLSVPVSAGSGEITLKKIQKTSFSSGTGWKLSESGRDTLRYYGWARGENTIVTDTAGEAIAAVYDAMGAVTDSRGRLVWKRTGRQNSRSIRVAEQDGVDASESRQQCIQQLLASQGLNVAAAEVLDENLSAMEWMDALFPGAAVNLTGAPLRALLLFIDEGRPVLLMDAAHKYMLLVGYDSYNVMIYDPVLGYRYKMGQNDATEWLEKNSINAISFLSE